MKNLKTIITSTTFAKNHPQRIYQLFNERYTRPFKAFKYVKGNIYVQENI